MVDKELTGTYLEIKNDSEIIKKGLRKLCLCLAGEKQQVSYPETKLQQRAITRVLLLVLIVRHQSSSFPAHRLSEDVPIQPISTLIWEDISDSCLSHTQHFTFPFIVNLNLKNAHAPLLA